MHRILADEGPERAWPIVLTLIEKGSDHALCTVGAGVLENLIEQHWHDVIERDFTRHTSFFQANMPTSRKVSSDSADVARKVRAYIAALPPKTRAEVRKLRATIRAAAPGAVEGFSYGIPGFRLNGRPLVWYAGWAHHTSMYPITAGVRKALGAQLERYAMSKGTVGFPLGKPLPLPVVKRMVKARAAEVIGKPS